MSKERKPRYHPFMGTVIIEPEETVGRTNEPILRSPYGLEMYLWDLLKDTWKWGRDRFAPSLTQDSLDKQKTDEVETLISPSTEKLDPIPAKDFEQGLGFVVERNAKREEAGELEKTRLRTEEIDKKKRALDEQRRVDQTRLERRDNLTRDHNEERKRQEEAIKLELERLGVADRLAEIKDKIWPWEGEVEVNQYRGGLRHVYPYPVENMNSHSVERIEITSTLHSETWGKRLETEYYPSGKFFAGDSTVILEVRPFFLYKKVKEGEQPPSDRKIFTEPERMGWKTGDFISNFDFSTGQRRPQELLPEYQFYYEDPRTDLKIEWEDFYSRRIITPQLASIVSNSKASIGGTNYKYSASVPFGVGAADFNTVLLSVVEHFLGVKKIIQANESESGIELSRLRRDGKVFDRDELKD